MVVERISFSEGLAISLDLEPTFQISQAIMNGEGEVTALSAGRHDITPPAMTHNKYRYDLFVKPDGNGVCRMTPLFPDVVAYDPGTGRTRTGVTRTSIDDRGERIIIAGPNKEATGILVYECVYHTPGPSPER
jgi:hypothetical protein